nr:MAG: ORF2 [Torque teno polar bear virus 1]
MGCLLSLLRPRKPGWFPLLPVIELGARAESTVSIFRDGVAETTVETQAPPAPPSKVEISPAWENLQTKIWRSPPCLSI